MNLPEAFTEKMRALLGSEYETYIKSYEEPKVCGLRVNRAKISPEEFLDITTFQLKPVPWADNGFYYDPAEDVTKHPHYHAGLYYIQEPSAMIPAERLPVSEGDRVLDLCAAPGGKATELAAKLGGTGLLVANDISSSRAKGLLKNLELFGLGNILVTSETPERLTEYFPAFFDKILIDAPCSGEGMFRKDAGMVKSWQDRGPEYYAALQKTILQEAVKMLRPGGMILYSTCTFAKEENEDSIRYLLGLREGMKPVPVPWCEGFLEGEVEHSIRVFPHRVRGEGHFISLVKWDAGEEKQTGKAGGRTRKKLPEELEAFLQGLKGFPWRPELVEIRDGNVYLMPKETPGIRGLRFLRTGLFLGELKKNRFDPSQALAMALHREQAPSSVSLPCEDPRVIRYLKGETIELEEPGEKGWVLFCVDGFPLGWGKRLDSTLKNKYYPGWRLQ